MQDLKIKDVSKIDLILSDGPLMFKKFCQYIWVTFFSIAYDYSGAGQWQRFIVSRKAVQNCPSSGDFFITIFCTDHVADPTCHFSSRSLFVCKPQIGHRNILSLGHWLAISFTSLKHPICYTISWPISKNRSCPVFFVGLLFITGVKISYVLAYWQRRNPGDVTRNKYAQIAYRKSARFCILLNSEFYFFY